MGNNDEIYSTFEELIANTTPELASICTALREVITELDEDRVEIVWKNQDIASYGMGPKKMSEHYAYIGLYKKHVNLGFYHGAALPDPDGLLTGTGKRLRHIKITDVSEARSEPVRRLIEKAITERESAIA